MAKAARELTRLQTQAKQARVDLARLVAAERLLERVEAEDDVPIGAVVVGANFRFGKGAKGTPEFLSEYGEFETRRRVTALLIVRFPIQRRAGPKLFVVVAGFGVCMVAFGLSRQMWLSMLALALGAGFDTVSVVMSGAAGFSPAESW